jgi:MFS transporter, FSR family, fosmidomycin resistance protein
LPLTSERLVVFFAALGHALFHIVAALFLTLALVMAPAWRIAYSDLIGVWTLGAFLLGAGAPIAGWLSDELGETRLMIVYFLGLGASAMLCGLADRPQTLRWALAGIGVFGAIYHPVGTAWVVKNVKRRGRSIAAVGIAGSIGVALASLIAGALADRAGWRLAFIVPGAVTVAGGLALAAAYATRRVVDRDSDILPVAEVATRQVRRAFLPLVVSLALTTLIYHAFSTMLPKWMEREIGLSLGEGLTGIGGLVTFIYLAGALAQFVGGHFADRGRAREIYVISFVMKLAALLFATLVGGWPVVLAAIVIAFVFDIAAPVENVLIARYTPARRRGLAYGVRHGIAIVAAPLGVGMVALLYQPSAGFATLLLAMAAIVCVVLIAASLLPSEGAGRTSHRDGRFARAASRGLPGE